MWQSIYCRDSKIDAGRIKEHDRDIRLARTQTSAVSEHPNETGHYLLRDKVKFTGFRRPFTYDFNGIEIPDNGTTELKFQRHGCPPSSNTAADRHHNGSLRKQRQNRTMRIKMHQSQTTKVLLTLIHCQSTPSPDEEQQHSGRNVAIRIKVTKS